MQLHVIVGLSKETCPENLKLWAPLQLPLCSLQGWAESQPSESLVQPKWRVHLSFGQQPRVASTLEPAPGPITATALENWSLHPKSLQGYRQLLTHCTLCIQWSKVEKRSEQWQELTTGPPTGHGMGKAIARQAGKGEAKPLPVLAGSSSHESTQFLCTPTGMLLLIPIPSICYRSQ